MRLDRPAVLGLHAEVAAGGQLAHGVAQDAAEVHERHLAGLDRRDVRLHERVALADQLGEVLAGLRRRRRGADRPERAGGDRRLDDDLVAERGPRRVLLVRARAARQHRQRHDRDPGPLEVGEVALVVIPLDEAGGVDERRQRRDLAQLREELPVTPGVVPRRAQYDERRRGPVDRRVPRDELGMHAAIGERRHEQPRLGVGHRHHGAARHEQDLRGMCVRAAHRPPMTPASGDRGVRGRGDALRSVR